MLGGQNRSRYDRSVKKLIRTFLSSIIFFPAVLALGAVPTLNVSVVDSTGKTAYKGATDSRGIFVAPKVSPGNYAVQFVSKSAPKGSHYTLVVVAGTKKTSASAVTAEKLAAGGVAMKIEVKAGANIQAQVSAESQQTRIGKNGQLMVWIPPRVGSNIPGHWAESDSAEAKEVMTGNSLSNKNLQDRANQGITPKQGGDLNTKQTAGF